MEKTKVDMIVSDIMMPQMDGIDTIRELKKDVQFHIPVIALTADVTKGIEQTFLREGFCAYLSKPVMWSKLEDLLMKYLRDDLVFIREDLKEEQKIKDEEFKQLKGQLKENDIKIEEGLRLLDGDFMQYRKLMEFFTEYQEEYMRQVQQLMIQKEVKVDEITRMMHTLKSNAKAIGAIHLICLNWSGDEYLRHHGNLLNRRKMFCLIRKKRKKKTSKVKKKSKKN